PAELLELGPEGRIRELAEWPLGRAADDVVVEPGEDLRDAAQNVKVIFGLEARDDVEHLAQGGLARARERPLVVEQRQALLRRQARDAGGEQGDGAIVQGVAVEAHAAAVREVPGRLGELDRSGRLVQEEPRLLHPAVAGTVPDDER